MWPDEAERGPAEVGHSRRALERWWFVVWIALTTPAVALGVLLLTGPLERWAGSADTPEQRPARPAQPSAGPTRDPADTPPGLENRS